MQTLQTTEPEPSYSPSESDEPEVEVQPPKPKKRSNADVDAVAMLLGLSQGGEDEGAPRPPGPRAKRTYSTASGSPPNLPDITKKGSSRLGPADNRVRPPKAATKLLPEAKWRHIRLLDVQSALEAEDVIVFWAHYRFPEALTRNKAEGHLNFLPTHYDGKPDFFL